MIAVRELKKEDISVNKFARRIFERSIWKEQIFKRKF